MDRLIPTLGLAGLVILIFFVLWLGWRRRARGQAHIPAPHHPATGSEVLYGPIEGTYVATTSAGVPLDRISVHSLGLRTSAALFVTSEGVVIDRSGTGDILLPFADLDYVRAGQGMIGKFVEPDGLVIITWRLGDQAVDTGFRTRLAADRNLAISRIRETMGKH